MFITPNVTLGVAGKVSLELSKCQVLCEAQFYVSGLWSHMLLPIDTTLAKYIFFATPTRSQLRLVMALGWVGEALAEETVDVEYMMMIIRHGRGCELRTFLILRPSTVRFSFRPFA
jgi:hypothetical protein